MKTFYLIAVIAIWILELTVLKIYFGAGWDFIYFCLIMTVALVVLALGKTCMEIGRRK